MKNIVGAEFECDICAGTVAVSIDDVDAGVTVCPDCGTEYYLGEDEG